MHPTRTPRSRIGAREHTHPSGIIRPRPSRHLPARQEPWTTREALAQTLWDLGVRHAFGVLGGAVAKACAALQDVGIEIVHARHETGAAFMAAEAYFASGRPSVVFTTTGPGVTNAATGLVAAAIDGAKLITISGATDVGARGRLAFQETGPTANDLSEWLAPATSYLHWTLETADEIPRLCRRLADGLARPGGFVATIRLPVGVQARTSSAPAAPPPAGPVLTGDPDELDECAAHLSSGDFVVWLGHGARLHADKIRRFVERTQALVMASPRAKGIFPESHPQYLGVTGMFGGHERPRELFAASPPDYLLVLGSRLGEATSCYDPVFRPREKIIHVDVDANAFGMAYAEPETLGIVAEIGAFLDGLEPRLEGATHSAPHLGRTARAILPDDDPPGMVSPMTSMHAIQELVVDRSDAIVLADIGNSFAWANNLLRFDEPGRYRVSPAFAAMTHASAGAVGAALGGHRRAVAIVGDGAMLMGNEVSTAVQYGASVVWVVLNDSSYGMVRHGMSSIGMTPFATEIPTTDFAALGRALGAEGYRVTDRTGLRRALARALRSSGPVVIDVVTDPRPMPRFGVRNDALAGRWEK